MLAPLEDRSVLAEQGPEADEVCALGDPREFGDCGESNEMRELHDLRRALRTSRLRLRRSALASTRQLMALNAEVSRLQAICDRQGQQIARFGSGKAMVDLGRRLMTLTEANERLLEDSRRAVMLERVLGIADAERRRLAHERDVLARELCQLQRGLFPSVGMEGGDDVYAAV